MCNSFNYELCTEYFSLFIPLYPLLYHYPLLIPTNYRSTDRLSSYIGPPITFLICAPSSTLGLDRRKWKGLSNRGLISPSLLSIWKWASTRFISRLLTLAPYSRSSDTARGKKKHSPSNPPPRKRKKKILLLIITCWNWLFLGNPYTSFSIYNITLSRIPCIDLALFRYISRNPESTRFLWPFVRCAYQHRSISLCTHLPLI